MASKSQKDSGTTTTSTKTTKSESTDNSSLGAILGAVTGIIGVGLNSAMTWTLGDKQIESNERIANANAQALKEIGIAQASLRSQTSNTIAIFGIIVLLIAILYIILN